MSDFAVVPLVLEGSRVRLEPLRMDHVDALSAVGLDPELWRWISPAVTDREGMNGYVLTALAEAERGISLPFAIVDRSTREVVGSTRFGNISRENRRAEIGWTWIGSRWQRTPINTEAKLLMLSHAFDRWGANRVELKTDALNERSRRAIERIGGQFEGILRHHMTTHSGRLRDTVYYSILRHEWPNIRGRLEALIGSTSSAR